MQSCTCHETLTPETIAFYRGGLHTLAGSGIPFLVGGAYALQHYTGIVRHTKDFDIFVRPADAERTLRALGDAGYRTERTHPHWLGKAFADDAFVDVIYRSGNGLCEVDDDWFEHAVPEEVLGVRVGLCPPEEVVWAKAFIMERERYDGADIAHLLHANAEHLDWAGLVERFGPN